MCSTIFQYSPFLLRKIDTGEMKMNEPLALIIDDDQDLALVFREAVQMAGYRVETYYSGAVALARLAEIVPYLIVLDMHLPGVTGPEIFEYIQKTERLKAVKVIVASADDRLANSYSDQAILVLLKPISFVQLRDLAHSLL
jgi:CheY-like chemotaxis protein